MHPVALDARAAGSPHGHPKEEVYYVCSNCYGAEGRNCSVGERIEPPPSCPTDFRREREEWRIESCPPGDSAAEKGFEECDFERATEERNAEACSVCRSGVATLGPNAASRIFKRPGSPDVDPK
jgi:hypothetical protein